MCTYRRTVTYFLTVLRLLKSFVFGSTGTARCVRICLFAPQKYSYQQKVLQKYVCFYAELRINYFKLLGSMILILITNDRTSYYSLHLKSCFLYEVIFAFYVLTESLFGISYQNLVLNTIDWVVCTQNADRVFAEIWKCRS